MDDAQKEVKAMDSLTSDVESVPIRGMKPFPYSQNYVWWETNKVYLYS